MYMLAQEEKVKQALFVNSEVWLSDLIHDTANVFSQPQCNRWKTLIPRRMTPKITAFSPVKLPLMATFTFMKNFSDQRSKRILAKFTENPYVLILNDPRPPVQELVSSLVERAAVTLFDWSDDFVEFSNNENERRICRDICKFYCQQSDVVLTINDELRDRARSYGCTAVTIPNATNFFTFPPSSHTKGIKNRISGLGKPVIGYIGWLNGLRLDLDLIAHVVKERPHWQFVFMGPKSEEAPLGNEIPALKNVHVWEPVPYEEYPAYLAGLDVCILPNKISAHTKGNDPIKIYDYLASGNPVVTTQTAGTARFKEDIGWAEDKDQFLAYLDKAVVEQSETAREKRETLAREHSWQERIKEVFRAVEPVWPKAG